MAYLVFILITFALLAGFMALAEYEMRRGARLFPHERARLDQQVARMGFIIRHVDFSAFLRDEVRHLAARAGHDIAHLSLRLVRAVERLLTRLVRHLRSHHEIDVAAPRENARPFVKTLSDFKMRLQATRPEVPEL